ncbi:MAG: ribosomal RNA small subunit methyltransferase A [Phycisphaerales bacterium]|nr:MAG: ribosomal RNA small subunit methyltransferase A [Phycisphaerales bacterium]
MQTKNQIRELLASVGVAPRRKFGQHFLVDLNLLRLVVEAADIGPQDVVLEVGCGTGSLTQALAQRAGRVVSVEIDSVLAGLARSQLVDCDNVELVEADALSSKGVLNPVVIEAIDRAREQARGRLLLVANLPYDVASPLMVNLVKGPLLTETMVVTVQKEVADRMEAGPHGKHYGTLSVFLGATGQVQTLRVLKPSVFWPPPAVDSAVVRVVRDQAKSRRIDQMERFSEVVGLFMGHRRKMLRACVKHAPEALGNRDQWMRRFERCGIDPCRRPEALSPAQYVALANLCGRDEAGR